MPFTGKAKPNSTHSHSNSSRSSETWGMGFLLVFFSEDPPAIADKHKLFSSSSIRKNTSNLFTKAQSTISVCALLVFLSLLLFTLSTFEPTIPTINKTNPIPPRRFLSQKPTTEFNSAYPNHNSLIQSIWLSKLWKRNGVSLHGISSSALQGMGILYRRGTRAMSDLVVCHVAEDVSKDELRLFNRLFHRSGLTAKSDVVFIFPSLLLSSRFGYVIREENESFLKLVHHYRKLNSSTSRRTGLGFDVSQFVKVAKKGEEVAEPLWGKKFKTKFNYSEDELTRTSYGSVVSFDATELDSENSLAGFLDHVPMSLRRWACYTMLLGRVRRTFKHIMLVDVKNLVVVGDPLGPVRILSTESVLISAKPEPTTSSKHSKKNSGKTQSHFPVNPAIIMGGARGVRRLSNAMLVEIVRASMMHKRKNSVTESGILSQLASNEFIMKNINLVKSTESVAEASSLVGWNSYPNSVSSLSSSEYKTLQRGGSINNQELNSVIMKRICSFELDSSVYNDC